MSKYRTLTTIVGIPHMDQMTPNDTTQRFPMGAIVGAVDPYWGGAEFIYVKFSSTVTVKALCIILPVFNSTTLTWDFVASEAPSTAGMGQQLGVAVLGATTGMFGWLQISGVTPVKSNAAVAADTTFAIAATGQGGALANGKQVLGARVIGASTITKVKASTGGISGGDTINVTNTDGVFVGCYASGTGVGAAAIVTAVNAYENTVTVSVVNSAAVTGNVTFTYNNATIYYNVAILNRPIAQGQVV